MASCPLCEGEEGEGGCPPPVRPGSLMAWQLYPSLLVMKRDRTGRAGRAAAHGSDTHFLSCLPPPAQAPGFL